MNSSTINFNRLVLDLVINPVFPPGNVLVKVVAAQSKEPKMLGVFCSKMPIRTNEINTLFEYKWIFFCVVHAILRGGIYNHQTPTFQFHSNSFIGTTIVVNSITNALFIYIFLYLMEVCFLSLREIIIFSIHW